MLRQQQLLLAPLPNLKTLVMSRGLHKMSKYITRSKPIINAQPASKILLVLLGSLNENHKFIMYLVDQLLLLNRGIMALICNHKDFVIETHPFTGNYVLYLYASYLYTNLTGSLDKNEFTKYCMTDLKAVSAIELLHSAMWEIQFTTSSPLYVILTTKHINTLTADDLVGDWIRKQNQNARLPHNPSNQPAMPSYQYSWYPDPCPLTNVPQTGSKCVSHDFKTYYGLRESYQYCVKCDEKKPI